MRNLLILFVFLVIWQQNFVVESYVLASSTVNSNKIASEHSNTNHISNLVKPSEIRVPTLQELTTLIGASQLQQDTEKLDADKKTLTYAQLAQFLANWQVARDKDSYELATADDNSSSSRESNRSNELNHDEFKNDRR